MPPSHVARSSQRRRPVTASASGRPCEKSARVSAAARVSATRHSGLIRRRPRSRRSAPAAASSVCGNVHPALLPVAFEILPEIRELERGADRVRHPVQAGVAIARDAQHQTGRPDSRTAGSSPAGRANRRSGARRRPAGTRSADRRRAGCPDRSAASCRRAPGRSRRRPSLRRERVRQRPRAAGSASRRAAQAGPRVCVRPRRRSRRPDRAKP